MGNRGFLQSNAEQFFHGDREVWIEHAGVRYHLRITRRNKLILQK
jgi:hemin uptake protein HemP